MVNVGLLLLRLLSGGLMVLAHGWDKLINFSLKMDQFPDPIGVGSPISLALVVFAEFFCGILISVGLITRLACLPLIVTMVVAHFVIHAQDVFQRKELSLVYLGMYLVLVLTGPGSLSLDYLVLKKEKKFS